MSLRLSLSVLGCFALAFLSFLIENSFDNSNGHELILGATLRAQGRSRSALGFLSNLRHLTSGSLSKQELPFRIRDLSTSPCPSLCFSIYIARTRFVPDVLPFEPRKDVHLRVQFFFTLSPSGWHSSAGAIHHHTCFIQSKVRFPVFRSSRSRGAPATHVPTCLSSSVPHDHTSQLCERSYPYCAVGWLD